MTCAGTLKICGPPMPTKGTKRHAIRIPDPLWNQARTTAAEHGDNLSEIIRQALAEYIDTKLGEEK